MKIKKVAVSKEFKKDYVKIDKDILSSEYAKALYPKHASKIERVAQKKIKPHKSKKAISYTTFFTQERMLQVIYNKRKEIYNNLNTIHKGFYFKDKQTQAKELYLYLANNLEYNMSSREEVDKEYKEISSFIEKREALEKKLDYYEQAGDLTEEEEDKIVKDIYDLEKEIGSPQKIVGIVNLILIKNIYTALVEKKGVCSGFSYAYSFLLQGLNIPNHLVVVKKLYEEYPHIFNLLHIPVDNMTDHRLVDLTLGYKLETNKQKLIAFNINPNFYIKSGHYVNRVEFLEKTKPYSKDFLYHTVSDDKKVKDYINIVFGQKIYENDEEKFKDANCAQDNI